MEEEEKTPLTEVKYWVLGTSLYKHKVVHHWTEQPNKSITSSVVLLRRAQSALMHYQDTQFQSEQRLLVG